MPHDTLFFSFALVAVGVLTLAMLAGPGRRARRAPAAALTVTFATLAAAYVGGASLLGQPKPARLDVLSSRSGEEAQLAGSHYVEGRAIYLWLLRQGETAPRAYVLPWSQSAAEALQQAQGQAEANGTQVHVRGDLKRETADGGVEFYAPPPPPMPVKRSG